MKIIIFVLLISNLLFGQDFALEQFNINRNLLNQKGMMVLGTWAIGNIALGSIMMNNQSGSKKYFHQMNAGWNIFNLAIAGFGYYSALHGDTLLTLYQSVKEQKIIENILLFNAGLDIGYIMTGVWLREKSKNNTKHKARLKGYGSSLIIQGSFLCLFDLALYYLHYDNNSFLKPILESISFNSQEITIRMML